MILTEKERNEVKAFAVESNERHPSITSALMLGEMTLKFQDRRFWIHNRKILPSYCTYAWLDYHLWDSTGVRDEAMLTDTLVARLDSALSQLRRWHEMLTILEFNSMYEGLAYTRPLIIEHELYYLHLYIEREVQCMFDNVTASLRPNSNISDGALMYHNNLYQPEDLLASLKIEDSEVFDALAATGILERLPVATIDKLIKI